MHEVGKGRRTPPPFMVIDVASESWARLCGDLNAYDLAMGWMLEEGFDPNDVAKIEIFDRESPMPASPVWARLTNASGATKLEPLTFLPPPRLRKIVGVYPETDHPDPSKSDILFKNGHVDDPTPPFPSLSPREITDRVNVMEAEMENGQRAEFAYHVHAVAHGSVDQFGEPLYQWDDLSRCCKRAWETTAAAITAEVRGEQVVRETLAKSAGQAEALHAIAKALDALPERCPYHGSNTDPMGFPYPWTREACCDAGRPAQRRKRAEDALAMLRAGLGA